MNMKSIYFSLKKNILIAAAHVKLDTAFEVLVLTGT